MEVESKELLKQWGIQVVETKLARTKKEAVSISKGIGFPVVLKIVSPDVIHKSDSGGVRLGLANATQARPMVRSCYPSDKNIPKPRFRAYRCNPQLEPG